MRPQAEEFTRGSHEATIPHSVGTREVTFGGYRVLSTFIRKPGPQEAAPSEKDAQNKYVRLLGDKKKNVLYFLSV